MPGQLPGGESEVSDAGVGFRVAIVGNLKPKPPLAVAPFDAKQANAHQEAWAKHLGVGVEIANSIGIKLRLIPPGEFLMGSSAQQIEPFLNREVLPWPKRWIESEVPQKRVVLREPFYLGMHEVTGRTIPGIRSRHQLPHGG